MPNPFDLKGFVANGAGYLQGGLLRENWEHAITAIVQMTVKKTIHPGINFLIKHVGQIFRRMFGIALEDVKQRDEFSATLKLMPSSVESFLGGKFDDMLWKVMEDAANSSHEALAPMYSTLDPTLPTFNATYLEDDEDEELFTHHEGQYVKTPSKKDSFVSQIVTRFKEKAMSLHDLEDGEKAKQMLAEQNKKKALEKNCFLPDKRTSMINDRETELVIKTAFKYIIALMEFNMIVLRFQINHYLYTGFKNELDAWTRNILMEDCSNLVQPDNDLAKEIEDVKSKIDGLKDSLMEVQKMHSKF